MSATKAHRPGRSVRVSRGMEVVLVLRTSRSGRRAMKAANKMRFKARLIVFLIGLLVTEISTLTISVLIGLEGTKVPPVPFAVFACITLALAQRWVIVDATKAFDAAIRNRQVTLAGLPPQLISISQTCSRRWFVLLHVRLHPELLDADLD